MASVPDAVVAVQTTPEVTHLPDVGLLPTLTSLHAFEASHRGSPVVSAAFAAADADAEVADTLARFVEEERNGTVPLAATRLLLQQALAVFGVPAPTWTQDAYSRSVYVW